MSQEANSHGLGRDEHSSPIQTAQLLLANVISAVDDELSRQPHRQPRQEMPRSPDFPDSTRTLAPLTFSTTPSPPPGVRRLEA